MDTMGSAMRDNQTDTCHGNCGDGCAACSKSVQVDFRPRDIRMMRMLGAEDPKLAAAGDDISLVRDRFNN